MDQQIYMAPTIMFDKFVPNVATVNPDSPIFIHQAGSFVTDGQLEVAIHVSLLLLSPSRYITSRCQW